MTVIVQHINEQTIENAWEMFLSLCKEQNTEVFLSTDFEGFKNLICSPRSILKGLILQKEGKNLGIVLYYFGASPYAAAPFLSFKGLYIEPDHRKNGFATLLMKEIYDIAEENRCCFIQWNVVKDNSSAISYYKSFGFAPDCDPLLEYTQSLDEFRQGMSMREQMYK